MKSDTLTLLPTTPSSSITNMSFSTSTVPCAQEELALAANPLNEVPLTALSKKTRQQLSLLLNLKKLLRSEEGYERDWRGIAALSQQKTLCDESTMTGDDPMARVLQAWVSHNAKTATFMHLERYLGFIDRWDVCDDIYDNLVEDARLYREKLQHKPESIDTSGPDADYGHGSVETNLTNDDVLRAQKGLPPQKYDAFVLFADADINYAVEMLTKLEENPAYNFKLCLKDRDLLAGISFPHEALSQLIEERCKHLIVILTEEFLKSPENKFLVNYTQALQIEHRTRKIIPLLYDESVIIPRTLKIYTHLKYNTKNTALYNFWLKLADSIRDANISTEPLTLSSRENKTLTTKYIANNAHTQQKVLKDLPTPPTDIPSISINGHAAPLEDDNDIPKKKERNKFKKRGSLRQNSAGSKLQTTETLVALPKLRNAHSTSQLATAVFYDNQMIDDYSTSNCASDLKKKKKWSSKLKRVFSRSSSRLMEA